MFWVAVMMEASLMSNANIMLSEAELDVDYIITEIDTQDEELESFLLTLGCYVGEVITVVSSLGENLVVSINDARYGIDRELAEAVNVRVSE